MAQQNVHLPVSRKKLVWTIFLNVGITLAEFLGGLLSGYLALIADAMHNLSDVAGLLLAWLGAKGSERPATKTSTYGYKRVEVMTAFISAVTLVVIAVYIFLEAYERFLNPQPIVRPWLFLSVAVAGLLGNVFSVRFLSSEKDKSLNMKTAFLHMVYDTLSSVAVIAGGIVIIITGWIAIDIVLSCIIALMILWSSYFVIRDVVMIFLEAVPPGVAFDEVHQAILAVSRVKNVHDLHIWSLSSHEIALSCHVCLNENYYKFGPDIIIEINRMLRERFGIGHGTIQLEKSDSALSDPLRRNRDHHWE